jgi:UDP-N-acetylglucosamine--N-acetylmuramyl-(pentapeptide) pyrophosphoryl-undecaprenol N-acetylglucosamine transferase
MGGFTSAPPVLAAKRFGARTFLHESNIVAGKANRWLALVVNEVFVGFEKAAGRLQHRQVRLTGTPVRKQFQQRDSYPCRVALGLDPSRPVLLVMGGSQGAAGINQLIEKTLPLLVQEAPELQLLHLTGPRDAQTISRTCASLRLKAVVHPFFNEMELVLGAATVAVSRAGASSMAELAAMRVPAVLVPFPAATDNHQLLNARAFQETGAACVAEQSDATPESLSRQILDLITKPDLRHRIQQALASWHAPKAAEMIADEILRNTRPRPVEIHCGCEKGECGCSSPEPGARRNVTLA